MRSLAALAALFFSGLCTVSVQAVECPKDINPCKVMILSPQQHQWLSGTKETSSGSLLDAAVKTIGSDGAGVVAQVLMRARSAVDGEAPKGIKPR